jgi:hypothetical protein
VVLLEERNRELVVEAASGSSSGGGGGVGADRGHGGVHAGPTGAPVHGPRLQHSTDLQQEISMQDFNTRLCSNLY